MTRLKWHILAVTGILAACVSHSVEVEPVEIKPIHVTMDINLRVERELTDFFSFEEEVKEQIGEDGSAGTTEGAER